MNHHRRRALVVLAGAATTSLAARALTPSRRLSDTLGPINLDRAIPLSITDWLSKGNDSLTIVNPETENILKRKYDDILSRTYTDVHGYRIMLSVAYGANQSDLISVHRPEGCYPAQGFVVDDIRSENLDISGYQLPVTRVFTHFGNSRFEPVSYWITIGGQALRFQAEKKIIELRYAMSGLIPDGLIVRVSSIDRSRENALAQQNEFIRHLLGALSPDNRRRFSGISV